MSMSMRDRMKAGKLFTDMCEGLPEERLRGKELMYEFNHTRPSEIKKREKLIREIFASVGENAWIEPPLFLLRQQYSHWQKSSTPILTLPLWMITRSPSAITF